MRFSTRRFAPILCLTIVACFAAASASAVGPVEHHYTLFQDGYSEGATVTGAFTGSDLDGNGILVHFPLQDGAPDFPIEHLELSAFSMHFSGNSLSPAFDLTLGDLYGFVYQLGTQFIGDDPAHEPTLNVDLVEGIGAIGPVRFYTSGLGPNGFIGGYVGGHIDLSGPLDLAGHALDTSQHLVRVNPVPEPGTGILAILVGFSAAAGRRRV